MIKKVLNNFFIGLFIGIAGPLGGFFIYGIRFVSRHENISYNYYINEIFLNTPEAQAPIIAVSLIFNALIFYFYLRYDLMNGAKGVVTGTMLYVPVVLYLKFFV